MEVITAVVGFAAGFVAAVVSSYWGPKWLRRAAAVTGARAGLMAIRLYVASAQKIPAQQDLQVTWSQACAKSFGEVLAHAVELGKEPQLDEVDGLLRGWLEQAPFIGGNDLKVKALGEHLGKLDVALDAAINSVERR